MPIVTRLINHHLLSDEWDSETVTALKTAILDDLKERWQVLTENILDALIMAAYLDPRVKDFKFVEDVILREALLKKAKEATERFLAHRSSLSPSQEDGSATDGKCKEKEANVKAKLVGIFGQDLISGVARRSDGDEVEKRIHAEILRYHNRSACPLFCRSLQDDEEDSVLDPLDWWRTHQRKYPRIAKLARRFLAMAAASVPSERVFSKGGWIVNKRRCSLSTTNVSLLMFLTCNQHHARK
jgi:zinc finger BED domain-containing protein 1 (E3 SUMO-protein ligase ZBED1)